MTCQVERRCARRTTSSTPPESRRVDAVGIEERAAALAKRSIKKEAKRAGIRLAISMIDLTTLEGKDSEGKVLQLCQKARHPLPGDASVPAVAAVCVYPNFVAVARRGLAGTPIKVASVATGFPVGARAARQSSSTRRGARSKPAPTRSTW